MVLNAVLGFVMIIAICSTLGDMEDVLSNPTHIVFIPIFYNVVMWLLK